MDGAKTLWDCAKNADGVQKRVETGLKKLRDSYAQGQKSGVAREVVASTANALLKEAPVAVINKLSGGALTNVATLEDDNKLWRGKLTHLRFLAHELSEELNELLVNSDKLATQLSADPDSKKKLAALRSFQADINKLLTEGFIVPSMDGQNLWRNCRTSPPCLAARLAPSHQNKRPPAQSAATQVRNPQLLYER